MVVVFEENFRGMIKKEHQSAKGRQVITLTLAITLRVTLVRDFVKSLFTLYIYILSLKWYFYTKQAIGCLSNWIIFVLKTVTHFVYIYIYYIILVGCGGSSWVV